MKNFKKFLLFFLLLLCFDLLFWRFVFHEDRSISSAAGSSLFLSLLWLISNKSIGRFNSRWFAHPGLKLKSKENLILDSVANKINGVEVTGGKLFLTDQRLVFIPTRSKGENRQMEFDRSQIASIQSHAEFPKAIVVVTKDKSIHAFNVDLHEQWTRELTKD
jgi:hypothetical protein